MLDGERRIFVPNMRGGAIQWANYMSNAKRWTAVTRLYGKPLMWRYMSGEGQDQNVQITCCSTYGKQLLRNLCSTTGVRQPEVLCADHSLLDIRQTTVAQPVFDSRKSSVQFPLNIRKKAVTPLS